MADDSQWETAPLSKLTDHIVKNHHVYLQQRLPFLCEQVTNEVRRYWKKHPEFLQAHTLLYAARAAIEQHLIKEETAGFPLIAAHEADSTKSLAPFIDTIGEHVATHRSISDTLQRIRATLWDYKPPEDVGGDASFTFTQLSELEADLAKHIHLEDDILFPRVRDAGGSA